MKLAFSTLGCPDWTLEQCVAAAGAYGYAGIELRYSARNCTADQPIQFRLQIEQA